MQIQINHMQHLLKAGYCFPILTQSL